MNPLIVLVVRTLELVFLIRRASIVFVSIAPNDTEKSSRLGTYVSTTTAGEVVKAFVPPPLPPDPPVNLSGLYQQADALSARLYHT